MINQGENVMNWDEYFWEINLKFRDAKVLK